MRSVYIVSAVRTPIGKFGGELMFLTAPELGACSGKEAIKRANIQPDEIDEVIFGNARQAGVRPNPARQVGFKSGVPVTIPAYTVNKACGSGLQAIINGYQSIVLGDADTVLVGGMESMSNTPYLLMNARWGYRLGNSKVIDGMYQDGFLCPLCEQVMGETAENLSEKYKISRAEQDKYAVMSQNRCEQARKLNKFKDEVIPVEIKDNKGNTKVISLDEHPRDGVTLENISKLPTVFKKDGTVHAGNSSGITDGASALVLMSEDKLKKSNSKPLARIVRYTTCGVDPSIMGIGPVHAIKKLLEKENLKLGDIDLIELNEAFASQVLACDRELHFDMEKLNVNGGAIALGHPIGCTGARIVVTLLYEMIKRKSKKGLATLCISGGMGMALLVESMNY